MFVSRQIENVAFATRRSDIPVLSRFLPGTAFFLGFGSRFQSRFLPGGLFLGMAERGNKGGFAPGPGFFHLFLGFRPTRNQTQFPGGFQPRFRIPVSNPGSDPDRADPGFGSPFAGNPEVPKTRRGVGENNL